MRTVLVSSAALLVLGCATAANATTTELPEEILVEAVVTTELEAAIAAVIEPPVLVPQVRYTGYYYGLDNPGQLADIIDQALRDDPTGRSKINEAKCLADGSCAAPLNYLESFQDKDPHGGWTLENLAEKLRTLALNCDLDGVFQMDRIIVRGPGLGQTDLNGMTRSLEDGECAWVNPATGRPVLAGKCTNPVGERIDIVCVYVDIEVRNPREFAVVWARYEEETDPCFAYRRVSRLYEPDSPSARWQVIPDNCIGRPCDLTQVNRALGREQVADGAIPLDSPGRYQIRLSPDELLVLCLKYRNEQGQVESSFAAGFRWQQDYQLVGREWHARGYYRSDEAVNDGHSLSGPKGLAFWAADVQAERQMRGLTSR